ncbi:hypothetical protein CTI12_AA512960 [Artemisia annua]|uniref:Uncharacterized protein n=1 Tax=Artemisia annua TaxID=35608 RepID=A0A2U1LAQ3_ARTAN|nr:hypothetical protein CTI12_AA512960 [Artemisia annua]
MATTTTFFHTRPGQVEPSVRSTSNHGCAKLDGVAMWLMNGVANAFFASLQRCSCIRIATVDDHEDLNDLPLIFNDGNLRNDQGHDAVASSVAKATTNVSCVFVHHGNLH